MIKTGINLIRLILAAIASFFVAALAANVHAQTINSAPPLSPFYVSGTTITTRVPGNSFQVPSLSGKSCIGTDSFGTFVTGSCSGATTSPAGSSNQIQYNLGGNFAATSSFVILPNGNVGIGTTSPTYSLSVVSTSTPSNVAAFYKTAGPVIMSVNQDSTGAGVVNVNPSFDGNFLGGALNVTNRANIANIQPTLVLNSVYGTQNGIQTIKFLFNAAAAGSAMIGNPVATAPGTAGVGGELNFYTSSNFNSNVALVEAMRIDALQNVGIGTTTPLAKLDVVGRLGSTTPLLVVASTTGANTFSNLLTVLPNGNVGVGTSNPTSFIHVLTPTSGVVARITAESTASTNGFAEFQMKSNISDVRFGTGGSGTAPFGSTAGSGYFGTVTDNPILLATANVVRVFIGNNATNGGNVGIGTSTPSAPLTVYNTTAQGNIFNVIASTTAGASTRGNDYLTVNNTTGVTMRGRGGEDTYQFMSGAMQYYFGTEASPRYSLESSRNNFDAPGGFNAVGTGVRNGNSNVANSFFVGQVAANSVLTGLWGTFNGSTSLYEPIAVSDSLGNFIIGTTTPSGTFTVMASSSTSTVMNLVTPGGLSLFRVMSNGTVIDSGTKPVVSTSTGAGTNGTASIVGAPNGGVITVTTAGCSVTCTGSAIVASTTYPTSCPTGSAVSLNAANSLTDALTANAYAVGNQFGFTITSGATGLTNSATYAWNFGVTCY